VVVFCGQQSSTLGSTSVAPTRTLGVVSTATISHCRKPSARSRVLCGIFSLPTVARIVPAHHPRPDLALSVRQEHHYSATPQTATHLPSRFARSRRSLAHPPEDSLRSTSEQSVASLPTTSHDAVARRDSRQRAPRRIDVSRNQRKPSRTTDSGSERPCRARWRRPRGWPPIGWDGCESSRRRLRVVHPSPLRARVRR